MRPGCEQGVEGGEGSLRPHRFGEGDGYLERFVISDLSLQRRDKLGQRGAMLGLMLAYFRRDNFGID